MTLYVSVNVTARLLRLWEHEVFSNMNGDFLANQRGNPPQSILISGEGQYVCQCFPGECRMVEGTPCIVEGKLIVPTKQITMTVDELKDSIITEALLYQQEMDLWAPPNTLFQKLAAYRAAMFPGH